MNNGASSLAGQGGLEQPVIYGISL